MSNIDNRKMSQADNSLLDSYLQEISAYRPLSDEEEARLSSLALEGDTKAQEQLVKANLKFVVSIARQYATSGVDMMDLINEGNIALIQAATKYDASRGGRFSTYAVWALRRAMEAMLPDEEILNRRKDADLLEGGIPAIAADDTDGEQMEEILARLPEREREVLRAYFDTDNPMSMMEIGLNMGLKRERVRQIRNRALRRLKAKI